MSQVNNILYEEKEITEEEIQIAKKLMNNNIHPVMSYVYAFRNIKDINDLNNAEQLISFQLLENIEKSSIILRNAIQKNKRMCIVADYDADGATSCAIAVRGLKMFGANVNFIVPDRIVHGYGLTPSVIDEAIKKYDPELIVTVDNGIASFDGIDYANIKGIEVLVTDHHLQGDSIPNASCIVNPNQKICNFPSKNLAGCGVIFYVLAALRDYCIKMGDYTSKTAPNVFSLLDLVAIGTVSDLVKLDKNNKILINLGLKLIRNGQAKPGIMALIEVAKKNFHNLNSIDIGFGIGPRINAAGRLKDMTIGINCLLSDDFEESMNLAYELDNINKKRKVIETQMKEESLEPDTLQGGDFVKVAYSDSFHEGVIGIVASRLKEMFYKPTIVFAPSHDDELIKGSGRSINEIHLRDAIDYVHKKNPNIIVKFGGHAMAAGLTIKKEYFEEFINLFEEAVKYFANGIIYKNTKVVDLDLFADEINLDLAQEIKKEIWGQGFPQPLFSGVFEVKQQQILKEQHSKFILEKDGYSFEAIWFFYNELIQQEKIELVYSLSINEFRNNVNVQLLIDGVKNK